MLRSFTEQISAVSMGSLSTCFSGRRDVAFLKLGVGQAASGVPKIRKSCKSRPSRIANGFEWACLENPGAAMMERS